MDVRARAATRAAHFTDQLTGFDRLPFTHADLAHMTVQSLVAVRVFNDDHITIIPAPTGLGDFTVGRGQDVCAVRSREIDARVMFEAARKRIAAVSEA